MVDNGSQETPSFLYLRLPVKVTLRLPGGCFHPTVVILHLIPEDNKDCPTPPAIQQPGVDFFRDSILSVLPASLGQDILGGRQCGTVSSSFLQDSALTNCSTPFPGHLAGFSRTSVAFRYTFRFLPYHMANHTTLPHLKYLQTGCVRMFDGSASELEGFDNSIKQMLLKNNLPLYYGGTVRGDPEEDYEYVSSLEDNGKSNYKLGLRLCAGLTERFEKSALRWWLDYDGCANPTPNCWRKHADNPRRVLNSVPVGITEVSLYDLLKNHINSDMDTREAQLELECFRWKPFDKDKDDAMNVTEFRGHVERMLKRAGITLAFQRIRAIRNCLPPNFKDRVGMETTELKLWQQINTTYVTMVIDFMDTESCRQRIGYGTTGSNAAGFSRRS